MSSTIWTNDTRRGEGEEEGPPRAEATAVRYEVWKPMIAAGHLEPGPDKSLFHSRSNNTHASICMRAYILCTYFLCTLAMQPYTPGQSVSPLADGTHTRQTETSQPV